MTGFGAWVTAQGLGLSTRLLTRSRGILTLTRPVAGLLAKVRATFQRFTAHLATSRLRQPARLVLQDSLAAKASLLSEKRALGTAFFIGMTIVSCLGMAAGLRPFTRKRARRRFSPTRQGRG
jgi:hypothetical protein